MRTFRVAVLPGDGIGPEVTAQAVRALAAAAERFGFRLTFEEHPVGAAGVAALGDPLPAPTRAAVTRADAVLLGAVGDPALDHAPRHLRPETGLLALRALLGVYANLRPVVAREALAFCSPLRPEHLAGVDLVIVRELTGGLYYGEPRGRTGDAAVNTLRYSVVEVERVARVAFAAARARRRRVLSVDKANVLETSQLWRETVSRVAREYPDVTLEHAYVDYAAARLVSDAASIDVLLAENLFGDILSDEAAMLTGSIGMLPSASLDRNNKGLYEPSHGSAPDIAGKGVANPLATILSLAMMLRYSLNQPDAAARVEQAVQAVLAAGLRTGDIYSEGTRKVGTREMGDAVVAAITKKAITKG